MTSQDDARWIDRNAKLLIPVISGVVLALLGFVSQNLLSDYTNERENARLITQLQLEREKAESDLRKEIFKQVVSELISDKNSVNDQGKVDLSKQLLNDLPNQLLKLELLAQNFGDSLSLSPLFNEINNKLDQVGLSAKGNDRIIVESLRARLRGLAKRVASNQVSSLQLRGDLVEIEVPLTARGQEFQRHDAGTDFKWPDDEIEEELKPLKGLVSDEMYCEAFLKRKKEYSQIKVDGVARYLSLTLTPPDTRTMTVPVSLRICETEPSCPNTGQPASDACCHVEICSDAPLRNFSLDFFNFPKIDNTRLPEKNHNHRLAVVLEEFKKNGNPEHCGKADDSLESEVRCDEHLSIAALIFPSEYSSLRDRPSLRESVKLLERSKN